MAFDCPTGCAVVHDGVADAAEVGFGGTCHAERCEQVR
jgi:hypothetical protein